MESKLKTYFMILNHINDMYITKNHRHLTSYINLIMIKLYTLYLIIQKVPIAAIWDLMYSNLSYQLEFALETHW